MNEGFEKLFKIERPFSIKSYDILKNGSRTHIKCFVTWPFDASIQMPYTVKYFPYFSLIPSLINHEGKKTFFFISWFRSIPQMKGELFQIWKKVILILTISADDFIQIHFQVNNILNENIKFCNVEPFFFLLRFLKASFTCI